MQSHLPAWLIQATESQLQGISGKALAQEYARLSDAYRQGLPSKAGADPKLTWLAYLVGRLPATFAAVQAALRQIPAHLLEPCESLLDLGSGPGTAIWAAADLLPGLKSAYALEHSLEAIALGETLAASAPRKPHFQRGDLKSDLKGAPEADLVILSYAAIEAGAGVIEAAAAKAKKLFVLVEPGTPAGFRLVLEARKVLKGLVAPCPQEGACPLAENSASRWCHFSARLERGRMARLLKGGELGYEDEKFSYAAFSKLPSERVAARIVGHPRKSKGRVALELCRADGLAQLALAKQPKETYQRAKKAEWGDAWI